jgi:2-aminoadipate transaminase
LEGVFHLPHFFYSDKIITVKTYYYKEDLMIDIFSSIVLDKKLNSPLYKQVYSRLKEIIISGTLVSDFKLPSVRQLSTVLSINQITVVSAFKQLEREGYIYSRAGSGFYVSRILPFNNNIRQTENTIITDELYQQEDLTLINSGEINISENTINFASATPTPDLFPVNDFKVALNEVLDRDRGNVFGYQDSRGFYPLRESICGLLKNNRIDTIPENIQILSGAQQGIDIISKAFLRQGDYVITESPTYTGAIAVFKSRGAEIAEVEIKEDGPNLNHMEYSLKKYKPKLIYTIPSFQNPTGYTYSPYKRAELIKLAEKYNTYIIEDDYVSDLAFDGRTYDPMKAVDQNDRVIFIKSFSNIFMPGLRLGFMISPSNISGDILEAKHATDISTSGLLQRAFDFYIREGYWDKHFKFMFDSYKERYFKMENVLERNLPENFGFVRPGGGLHIWLNTPYGFAVNTLFRAAASKDIIFAPGKIFYSGNSPQKVNNIRLSFASVNNAQIETGVKNLCDIIKLFNK